MKRCVEAVVCCAVLSSECIRGAHHLLKDLQSTTHFSTAVNVDKRRRSQKQRKRLPEQFQGVFFF